MLRILDRYIIREIGPSLLLGLGVFTFVLLLNEILRYAQILISQAASLNHVLGILANLLPSVLCVTIPMGVLLGILIALGRMAADSEITALRASGVSLYRMLRPVLVSAAFGWAASSYLIINVLPDSNQAVRKLFFQVLTSKVQTDIRPRVFYDNLFPNLMFLVLDIPTGSDTWQNVFLADLSNPGSPQITLARQGQLIIDSEKRTVNFYLRSGESHKVTYDRPGDYDRQMFGETVLPVQGGSFFPAEDVNVPRGPREMGFEQLYQAHQSTNLPVYLVEIHKKFSIPFACFVFGILGLAFGVQNRREGRSWGFVLSIGLIFIYYVLIKLGEEMAIQGRLPPVLAMWGVNAVLGIAGLVLLIRNARETHAFPVSLSSLAQSVLGRLQKLKVRLVGGGGSVKPSSRPVLVVRIPRIVIRFPNTLDRYITREFLRYFALILAALVTVFVLGILLEILDTRVREPRQGETRLPLHWIESSADLLPYAPAVHAHGNSGEFCHLDEKRRDHRDQSRRDQPLSNLTGTHSHGPAGQFGLLCPARLRHPIFQPTCRGTGRRDSKTAGSDSEFDRPPVDAWPRRSDL